MRFVIQQSTLKEELDLAQSIVERKNMIPVLTNVLIESTSPETIRISATDLDVTIRAEVAVDEISEEGAICVQARKLFEIAKLLPDGPVTFTKQDNDWVTVETTTSTFKLPGIARETFAELPTFKATPFTVPAKRLNALIQQTIFAITQQEGRYTLSGAKFEVTKKRTRFVTTDGHRLALAETADGVKPAGDETLDVLIPRKTLAELSKVCASFEGDVALGADDNHLYFQIGRRSIASRMLAGQFPNYEMVLPKDNSNVAIFNRNDLSRAIRRALVMADDRSRSITLTIAPDQTLITTQSPEEGELREVLAAQLQGEGLTVGFNGEYVQDFLNATNAEEITYHFKDENTQGEFRPVTTSDDLYKCIIMPMRIA
jgi:DNA polymerase-3 subunit beta